MMVSPGYEPDGHITSAKKKGYGTPEDYKAVWRHFYNTFKEEGVTNAVWAMDYGI